MSLARQHRDRVLAEQTAVRSGSEGGLPGAPMSLGDVVADHANRAQAQITMRLSHDLRRLKEIQSIERKIDAKREMLPEYDAWVEGLMNAVAATGSVVADDVLPTIMVWRIDVGAYADAMPLIEYVLGHNVQLPSRYARTAPALIAEEIATAALKAQLAGEDFPLGILLAIESLTDDRDMHDEIRAKLQKAIGFELADIAEETAPDSPGYIAAIEAALVPLRRAQQLHERAGAKDRIKKLEKLLATARAAQTEKEQAGSTG